VRHALHRAHYPRGSVSGSRAASGNASSRMPGATITGVGFGPVGEPKRSAYVRSRNVSVPVLWGPLRIVAVPVACAYARVPPVMAIVKLPLPPAGPIP
jgi:hypothetical protein